MIEMDPTTGLAQIPWKGYFWRVKASYGGKYHYIELRKNVKTFWLFDSSVLIHDQILLELTKPEMAKRSREVIATLTNVMKNTELLGDYPPKSIA